MLSDGVTAVRVLGLVVVGGVISTGLSLYLSFRFRSSKRGDESHDPSPDQSLHNNHDHNEINRRDVCEVMTDIPLDFRVVIHGGAGVVSKGIDSKPFFDALTRIMADAYKFAKDGEKTGVTGIKFSPFSKTFFPTIFLIKFFILFHFNHSEHRCVDDSNLNNILSCVPAFFVS